MVARLTRILRSPLAVRFAAAYLAVLLPTLVVKYIFLTRIYEGGLGAAVQPILLAGGSLPGWVYAVLFFTRDFLEVALMVAILLIPAQFTRRSRGDHLLYGGVVALLVAIGCNYVCFRQLGTFLTLDIVKISLTWIREDPSTVPHFVTPRRVVAVAAILAWAVIPVALGRRASRARTATRAFSTPLLPLIAGLLIVVAALSDVVLAAPPSEIASPLQGYWSRSLLTFLALDERAPSAGRFSAVSEIKAAYDRLVFRGPSPAAPSSAMDLGAARRRTRHVLIVVLETAPRKYYPLGALPSLPVFERMSHHAIVSDQHYATAPSTSWSLFSILSGTYPTQGDLLSKYGEFRTDGLGSVLTHHGYESVYIESTYMSYWHRHRRMLQSLGFERLFEAQEMSVYTRYERSVRNEEVAFQRALDAILGAAGRGKKALVCLSTAFGHFPWKAGPDEQTLPAAERVRGTARLFDALLGRLLDALAARGLRDDIIIVVTGDHGLRVKVEFDSLKEEMQHGDLTFNVPLLVYAPALFPSEMRLNSVTSHVDIAPTILDMVGVKRDVQLHHGTSLLDPRLATRITFLMSAGYYAIDGFRWDGRVFLLNNLTGQVTVRAASPGAAPAVARSAVEAGDVPLILREARMLFEGTAAHFLARGR